MKESPSIKRWEITLCPTETLHVHYQTGSPEVFQEGFKGLARELREVADQLEAIAMARKDQRE
jgi:hypothetical protein